MSSSTTAQLAAIQSAISYLKGGPKPRKAEADLIAAQLADAMQTLRSREQLGRDPWRGRT